VDIRTRQRLGVAHGLAQPAAKLFFLALQGSDAFGNPSRCGELNQRQAVLSQVVGQETGVEFIGRWELHRPKTRRRGGFDTLQKRLFIELETEMNIELEHGVNIRPGKK